MKLNLFRLKFVHPIGRKQFQLYILRSFLLQIFVILLSILALKYCRLDLFAKIDTYFYLILIMLVNTVISFTIFDFQKFRARFKDIYPDKEFGLLYYTLSSVIPFWFFGLIVFLCITEEEGKKPAKLFKIRFAIPAVTFVLVVQSLSPGLAYWTSNATHYFITDVLHSTKSIISLKSEAKGDKTVVENYYKAHAGKMYSTQLILLVAVHAALIIDMKKREIANHVDVTEAFFNAILDILESNIAFLKEAEIMAEDKFVFSPLHWITPSGPFEIILLTTVENSIMKKFCPTVLNKSMGLLIHAEKKLTKFESPNKSAYAKRIATLKKEFQNSNTYKASKALSSL